MIPSPRARATTVEVIVRASLSQNQSLTLCPETERVRARARVLPSPNGSQVYIILNHWVQMIIITPRARAKAKEELSQRKVVPNQVGRERAGTQTTAQAQDLDRELRAEARRRA